MTNRNDAMERSCGAVLYRLTDGAPQYVLVLGGDWGFPKGHMEAGETELETALRELAGVGDLSSAYLGRVIRILGLACLTEAGTRIARDGGQGNIALKVELCGRVLILCAALPAVREVLFAAQTVLQEIGP